MAYFELRIGNTFKDENGCDEFGEKLCKVDKSEYVVMYSEKVQSELFSLKIYSAFKTIFMLSCYMDKKTNALLYKKKPLNCRQISALLNEKYDTFRRVIWELVGMELIKKIKVDGETTYIINPYFAFKGKSVSIELYELFKDTRWAEYEDLSEYLPQRGDTYYNEWVSNVLERDNRTCQCCGSKLNPQAHHLKSYAKHKELRTDVNNGITLCECCHSPMVLNGFHQKYGTYNNTPEQLLEYIKIKRKELGITDTSFIRSPLLLEHIEEL